MGSDLESATHILYLVLVSHLIEVRLVEVSASRIWPLAVMKQLKLVEVFYSRFLLAAHFG